MHGLAPSSLALRLKMCGQTLWGPNGQGQACCNWLKAVLSCNRERAAGYYAVYPFAAAQAVIELPYVAVQSILFSFITYFMIYFYIQPGEA